MPARRWSTPCRSTLAPLLAVAPVLLFSVHVAGAAQDRPAAEPAAPLILSPGLTITPGLSATEYYDLAVAKLRRRRNFERAILELREAVKQEPENRTYQIALGCAFAGRAASLGNAASYVNMFARDQGKFKQRLAAWETAQKDRSSSLYRKPRPLPPVLRTKDDKKPFTLTSDEAAKRFTPLALAAVAAWDKSLTLAKTDDERAEAQWYRGWGIRLLHGFGKWFGVNKIKDVPVLAQATKAFETANELAPNDARYWQSLGDDVLDYDCDRGAALSAGAPDPIKHALDAYRQAATRDKRNVLLWYRLYELQRFDNAAASADPLIGLQNREQSENALRQAVRWDAGNAFPLYRLAGLRLYETPYSLFDQAIRGAIKDDAPEPPREQTTTRVLAALTEKERVAAREAIRLIEQGNRAPRFTLPFYQPAVPPLLSAAWNFRRHIWLRETWWDFLAFNTVASVACDYARVTAKQGDGDRAARAARAVITMGERLGRDVWDQMKPGDYEMMQTWHTGVAAAASGYAALADVYDALGDADRAAQARKAAEAVGVISSERQAQLGKAAEEGYGNY